MAALIITAAFPNQAEKEQFFSTAQHLYEKYEEFDIEDDIESFTPVFNEQASGYGGAAEQYIRNWSYEDRSAEDFIGQMIPEDLNDRCVNVMFFGVQGNAESAAYDQREVDLATGFLAACGADAEIVDDEIATILQGAVGEAMAQDMTQTIAGAYSASEINKRLERFARDVVKR